MTGPAFAALLEREGFDFAAGVPCSLIEDLLATLERHPRVPYVDAVREDVAVGLAGGAWLAGRRPVVLMQNSGLGTSLNALASFSLMYGLPALLVVTWRGRGGADAPEHLLTGAITEPLLGLLGIPHRVLSATSADADIRWARAEMDARTQPVALIVPPEWAFSSEGASAAPSETSPPDVGAAATPPLSSAGASTAPSETSPPDIGAAAKPPLERDGTARVEESLGRGEAARVEADLRPRISRYAAIEAAMKELGEELLVSCNGYPSREACAIADRARNFYMIGSMGLAASIGLGVALAKPHRPVVVLDGDGNLMMALGAVANVVAAAPRNLVHCVFDNEVYGSTGNQRSPSGRVRLDRVAAAAGYRTVVAVTEAVDVAAAVRAALASSGPHFVLVKVTREEAEVPRIPHTPRAIRDRFRRSAVSA